MVSADLRDFIQEVLETQELNSKLFSKLPGEDQALFKKIAKLAHIDKRLGLKVESEDPDRELLKRFELVRGEVVAGNNSEVVLKELKVLTKKLLTEGRLPRVVATELLIELSALV